MRDKRLSSLILFSVLGLMVVLSGCQTTPKSTSGASTVDDDAMVSAEEEMVEPVPGADSDISESPVMGDMGGGISASDLEDVFFDFDDSRIQQDARASLERTAALLRDNPGVKVKIEGHCDERGTNEYNLALGERRAKSIRQFLVALGVNSSRLSTISYGEERSTCSDASEECYARNRRGHFVIQ